jgi:hypothetical protein
LSPAAQRLQLRLQRTYGDFLVPVLGTLLQSRQEFFARADSAGRSGEEQELFGVLAGEPAPDHIEVGDAGNLADAYATGGSRPRDDHFAYELRLHQRDFLSDHSAQRKPEEVHLLETHRLDEGDCVLGHLLHRTRR